jgi:hypothetical protein
MICESDAILNIVILFTANVRWPNTAQIIVFWITGRVSKSKIGAKAERGS